MNFAKLLLESYGKLHERIVVQPQNGVQTLLNLAMSITQPGQTIAQTGYSEDKGETTGEVGRGENGPYLKGGPFGSKTVNLMLATPEQRTAIDNWLNAPEAKQNAEGGIGTDAAPDPIESNKLVQQMKGKKKEENVERIRKVEETFPGYLDTMTSFYDNVKDGITESYSQRMEGGKYTAKITETSLISKIFGGKTEGSVTHNIEQEIGRGDVRRESESQDKVLFARDTTDLEDIQGVLGTFKRLGDAYKRMTTCESTPEDHEFVRENIRHDPSSGAYFYKDATSDNNFGMALSLAQQNIMNLVGEDYNNRVDACDNIEDKESAKIPSIEIAPAAREGVTNYSNIVKEASERAVEIAFLASAGKMEEAGELLSGLISEFGKNVFLALKAKRRADRGQKLVDEDYASVFEFVDFLGIETDDDIVSLAKEHFLPYFSELYDDMTELKPSYVTRVGGGSVGSGDKTDVDYTWKERPDLSQTDFAEADIIEVKFEDLDPATQRNIRRSGDTIQDTYYRIDDSLKYYGQEGDVKLGDSSSTRTSIGRLIGRPSENSRNPERDIQHGRRTMDRIRSAIEANEGVNADKVMAETETILTNIHDASTKVSRLMDTESWSNPNYTTSASKKAMVRKHLEDIFEGAGLGNFNKYVKVKDVLDVYEKEGPDRAAGMIDRAITQGILSKNITVRGGKVDKKKSLAGLAAFAALHASTAIDTMDNRNPMSSIKIKETGNVYRERQNDMAMEPVNDMLDLSTERGLSMGQQTWRIDRDGGFKFAADRRRCSGTCYINTNHLKPRSKKKK